MSLKVVLILANSVDSDEMQHYVSLNKTLNPVQPRKTRPDMTETLLTGT